VTCACQLLFKVWTSPPSPAPIKIIPEEIPESALQEEARTAKERVLAILQEIQGLGQQFPGIAERSAVSPTTISPLEKKMEILHLKLTDAEAVEQRLGLKVQHHNATSAKQHEKKNAATAFEEQKRKWLRLHGRDEFNEGDYYGKPTGCGRYDQRYLIPKPMRKAALIALYYGDRRALEAQLAVLNQAVHEDADLADSTKAARCVHMQDDIEQVITQIVDSDIHFRPLTKPQLDKVTSLPVILREARIRGIPLEPGQEELAAMREMLRQNPVITGEVVKVVDQSIGQGSHNFNLSLPTRPYMFTVYPGDAARTEEYDQLSPTQQSLSPSRSPH